MFSEIGIGPLCGFLYLFVLLTSALSKSLAGTPLHLEDVSGTFGMAAGGGKRYRVSTFVDLVSHDSIIALAGALYVTFSPYNRILALVAMPWRVAGQELPRSRLAAIIAYSSISTRMEIAREETRSED